MHKLKYTGVVAIVVSAISCTPIEIEDGNLSKRKSDSIVEFHDAPSSEIIIDVLKRASLMANIQWLPLGPVPNMLGSFYPQGRMVTGIPYSSGKELCTFVGQDVSIYSFLSAVKNPYSYLYTEDLSCPPYNSSLCRSYYGTVCSAAVDYALGLPIQFTTYMYKGLPFFSVITNASMDKLKLCDLLLEDGHVGMIYDIIRDFNGSITQISVFESVHEGTRIKTYSRSQFIAQWKNTGWEILRYKFKEQPKFNTAESSVLEDDMVFNSYLSTAKGDCVSYAKRDSIIINYLDNSSGTLMILKDHCLLRSMPVNGYDHELVFYDLPCGDYELYIQREDLSRTPSIYFDIVDTDVSIDVNEKVTVHFNTSESTPIYLIFCQLTHRYLSFWEITEEDLASGFISVIPENRNTYYYKVLFQGRYGRVASELQPVK